MSLNDFKGQLYGIKQNFHKLSVDERSEAVVLVQKLQEMLLTKDGSLSEKPSNTVGSVHKMSAASEDVIISCNNPDEFVAGLDRFPNTTKNALPFCKVCSKTFLSWNCYLKHSSRHTCNACPFCSNKFSRKKDLCHHLKSEHKIRISFKNHCCLFCRKSFNKETVFQVHIQKHLHSLSTCSTVKKDQQAIKARSAVESLKLPKSKTFTERLKCSLCILSFPSLRHLEKHKQVDHEICSKSSKCYSCQDCNETFTKNYLFQAHKQLHTTANELPLCCSTCSKTFLSCDAYEKHIQLHCKPKNTEPVAEEGIKPISCSTCGSRFKYKQGLVRHIEQKHSNLPAYKCTYCDFSCRCKTNLKRHIGLHKNDRRFVCELCGSSFNALATLKGHYSYVHSSERKFVCNVCSRSFKGRSGLLRHLRIHKDDRPYICCYCTASYKRMSHLNRHMLSAHKQKLKSNRVHKVMVSETRSRYESSTKTVEAAAKPTTCSNSSKSLEQVSLDCQNESFDENAIWNSKLQSATSDLETSVEFPNACSGTPILSTIEIPLTTLEELSLNSIPFNVISSEESTMMVHYEQVKTQVESNVQMECNLADCILNEESHSLATLTTDEVSINSNDSPMELSNCISDTSELGIINQHSCNLKPVSKETLSLLDSQNCADSYGWNDLQVGFRKQNSSDLTNDACLMDLHVKHSDLTFSSLTKDTFVPALFTKSTSSLGQVASDISSNLSENTYPELISSFLAS